MNFGKDDGSVVAVTLDGATDEGGGGATAMLGATVMEVALFVPVGLMLCGAVLAGMISPDAPVSCMEEVTPVTVDPRTMAGSVVESDAAADDVTDPGAILVQTRSVRQLKTPRRPQTS